MVNLGLKKGSGPTFLGHPLIHLFVPSGVFDTFLWIRALNPKSAFEFKSSSANVAFGQFSYFLGFKPMDMFL